MAGGWQHGSRHIYPNYLTWMSLEREEAEERTMSSPKFQVVANNREVPQSQAALAVGHPEYMTPWPPPPLTLAGDE